MKKLFATFKNAVKALVEGNTQMAHYQVLCPVSCYYMNHTAWR